MNEFISKWCLRWAKQTQSGVCCVGQLEGASAFDDGGGQLGVGITGCMRCIKIPSLFEDLSK